MNTAMEIVLGFCVAALIALMLLLLGVLATDPTGEIPYCAEDKGVVFQYGEFMGIDLQDWEFMTDDQFELYCTENR